MSETLTIMKRELRAYFLSPIAYVVGSAFLFIGGYQFFKLLFFEYGQTPTASMTGYFAQLPTYFLVLAPALTMRLWSEEKKLGTLELLLTYPIRTRQLVFGKFFAALAFVGILLLLTLGYPITLAYLGELDWGPALSGYVGALLLAGTYMAFGLFASSITRDQIVALIISVVFLGVLEFMAQRGMVWLSPGWVDFLHVISPGQHFNSATRGVIAASDLIHFVVFSGLFLFLNGMVVEMKKKVG